MSHNFDTGFSVREVPWHGLGKVLDDYPGSWAEARILAGLDWDPISEGVYELTGMDPTGQPKFDLIPNFKQVKRSDSGARLDIATDSYELIGHDVMGEIVEAILGDTTTPITPRYETAGALEGGKRVWALVRLGDEIELPGDPSPLRRYMALLNSHDGTAALRAIATTVRIVCANTWHAADVDATKRGSAYSFRHTKNWKSKVEDAKKALASCHADIDHYIAEAEQMLAAKVSKMQRDTFIEQFAIKRVIANTVGKQPFGKTSLAERLEQPRVKSALVDTMGQLRGILDSRTCDGIRDSAYGLVQAAGEFADHFRTRRSDESHFSATVLNVEPLKLSAVRIARELVKTG